MSNEKHKPKTYYMRGVTDTRALEALKAMPACSHIPAPWRVEDGALICPDKEITPQGMADKLNQHAELLEELKTALDVIKGLPHRKAHVVSIEQTINKAEGN